VRLGEKAIALRRHGAMNCTICHSLWPLDVCHDVLCPDTPGLGYYY
jgi:hypothetical protein